jgi:hypothetical protein
MAALTRLPACVAAYLLGFPLNMLQVLAVFVLPFSRSGFHAILNRAQETWTEMYLCLRWTLPAKVSIHEMHFLAASFFQTLSPFLTFTSPSFATVRLNHCVRLL